MKAIIFYESTHHGNTKKLVDAIADKHEVDVADVSEKESINLEQYDMIGFASGICFSKFYENITNLAKEKLPSGKQVFFLYSCANNDKDFSKNIKQIAIEKNCRILGTYGCKGFNTYGPLKLIGGMNKKHPNQEELDGAVAFFENCKELGSEQLQDCYKKAGMENE